MTPPIVPKLMIDSTAPQLQREVRKFEDGQLQASIERALSALPDSHNAAVVDVGVDDGGIQAAVAVRLGWHWSIAGVLERRYTGEWVGFGRVRWSG